LQSSIIGEAVEFERLKKEMGMSGKELLEHFEQKCQESCQLQRDIMYAKKERESINSEVKKASSSLLEMQKQISKHKNLRSVSLEKLSQTASFISEFESLNFDVTQVKKIADLRVKLLEGGIDLDSIVEEIEYRGSLEDQNNALRIRIENGRDEIEKQSSIYDMYRTKNSVHKFVDQILHTWTISVPCKNCGVSSTIQLQTPEFYQDLQNKRLVLPNMCLLCGFPNQFTSFDIIFEIAGPILPYTINF